MEYDNTNRGILGKNKRKQQDSHPDYDGTLNVAGVEYYINAWLKTSSKTGEKFFSLSVKPKQPKQDAGGFRPQQRQAAPPPETDTMSKDDIRF